VGRTRAIQGSHLARNQGQEAVLTLALALALALAVMLILTLVLTLALVVALILGAAPKMTRIQQT
jgi:hypothetical protein